MTLRDYPERMNEWRAERTYVRTSTVMTMTLCFLHVFLPAQSQFDSLAGKSLSAASTNSFTKPQQFNEFIHVVWMVGWMDGWLSGWMIFGWVSKTRSIIHARVRIRIVLKL